MQMVKVIATPNTPDKNTAGIISPDRPHLSAIVNTANPNAEASAARLPAMLPPEKSSQTITKIPNSASPIASQVAFRTLSFNTIQPRIAVMKGAAENSKSAVATLVFWME